MRALILLGLLCVAAPAAAKDITVTATPVPLNPEDPAQTTVGALEYVAGFALDSPASEWGGYSGVVLAPDGSSLLAVSDVGHWLKLELKHDADGKLTGVGEARLEPLLDEAGKPVAGKEWSDAEEIAQSPDGQLFVSFERHHRIWRYALAAGVPDGPAHPVPIPGAIKALPENSGIEAMTAEGLGTLMMIAEGAESGAIESLGWTWDAKQNRWHRFLIGRSDSFEPTSLAVVSLPRLSVAQNFEFSPLLLLERRYTEADGPSVRIISINFPSFLKMSDRVAGTTLATLRLPLSVDNFEALAVRPAPGDQAFLYLLSDDNQSDRQRTLLLQFRTSRLN